MVFVLGPSRADAELQPSAGELVDRHGGLREHRGVAVGVAGDRATDPGTARARGHPGEERPRLEDAQAVVRAEAGEVVHVPAVVEAGVVGHPPDFREGVEGGGLAQLEPEAQWVHAPVLPESPHQSMALVLQS
jgi:hypothetical protein